LAAKVVPPRGVAWEGRVEVGAGYTVPVTYSRRLSAATLPVGVRYTRRRRRRSHKLLAASLLVAVAALAGGTVVGYVAVKSRADQLQAQLTTDVQAGQKELEAGKASLAQANAKRDAGLVSEATAHFASAREEFLAAGSLADNSRLLHDLELVPSLGDIARSRHTAVSGIAEMGVALSDAGRDLAALDAQLIKPPAARTAGGSLLTALDQSHTSLAAVRSDLGRAQKAAARVDAKILPVGQQTSFVKARDTIATALAGLDEFERLVPVLSDVLGGNGARTYLVEQVNPSELRPGGGFIGTYSVVRADQGRLSVVQSGDSYLLADPRPRPGQPGFIPEQDPLRDVIPQVSWSFVDTNIYPDFPTNAQAAVRFAEPRLRVKIDAVISIDYYAVAKMLELTGPLVVPGYGLTVDSSNFIPQIMQLELEGSPQHKAILAVIAGPLMSRLSALTADSWPSLLSDLNSLAAQRHIQVYFNTDVIEAEMNRVGWSGSFNPAGIRDYMMAVESNIGGGKVNYFLTRHYTVTLTRTGNVLHHKVAVDLVNNEPYRADAVVDYHAYGSLYAGGFVLSTSNNLQPAKYPKPAPPAGISLLEGWLPDVPCCGQSGQAVFEYDTPWPAHDGGGEVIYWQKQPGTVNDSIDVVWNDGLGHTFRTTGALSQDQVITLTSTGVALIPGHPAQATLPNLSLG
jgi:hypothetical protein